MFLRVHISLPNQFLFASVNQVVELYEICYRRTSLTFYLILFVALMNLDGNMDFINVWETNVENIRYKLLSFKA